MRANQIHLFFSPIAYTLLDALRRLGLTETSVAHSASGNLRLGHRAPGRGGRRASIPFKALPAHLSSLGAFCLFELRVF